MSFEALPAWLQGALLAEAFAVAWLTGRFGWRGLMWSAGAAVGFWFVFAFAASWLVGRLEGGRAAELDGLLHGAGQAVWRLSAVAAPLIAAGAALGGLVRFAAQRKARPRQ